MAASRRSGLVVDNLGVGYGKTQVVHNASLTVRPGEVVAVFGHNGAGKTTILRGILGLRPPLTGTVHLDDNELGSLPTSRIVRSGVAYVPSEHFVFGPLRVRDNLRLGAPPRLPKTELDARMRRVYALFPVLAERDQQIADTMSGGQQRMLSLGIALMSDPSVLLLDEPSLGLSPALTERLMQAVGELAREDGKAVLLLEQNVIAALPVVDRAYIVRSGRVVLEQTSEALLERDSYWDLY